MLNVHRLFQEALQPFAPPTRQTVSVVRVFDVTINGQTMTFAAKNAMDAISRAMDLFIEAGDDCPPEGIAISCIKRGSF